MTTDVQQHELVCSRALCEWCNCCEPFTHYIIHSVDVKCLETNPLMRYTHTYYNEIETWMLLLYCSQDVGTSQLDLCVGEQLSGLKTSCRRLKGDEQCCRPPSADTGPSLGCRRYAWKPSESPGPCDDPEVTVPSTVCVLFTAAVLLQKVLPSCRVEQTSLPSCGEIGSTENLTLI